MERDESVPLAFEERPPQGLEGQEVSEGMPEGMRWAQREVAADVAGLIDVTSMIDDLESLRSAGGR